MKVIYNREFNFSYCPDPAAASGRMECIVNAIQSNVTLVHAISAEAADIAACHSARHIEYVKKTGLYDIASLAAGAAVLAADTALSEPSFALIRPPGHHASFDSSWGFCYFNNMAIAISKLKRENRIHKAFILDIDLHFGDGTVNILQHENYVSICNPTESDAGKYLLQIERNLPTDADIIGVSAGFDNHLEDWGGLLSTEDYRQIGQMVHDAAQKSGGGCFAILEGGYNHQVLGKNVKAFIEGIEGSQDISY